MTMGAYQTLTVEKSGRVAIVTFRRADQLNAMNRLMQGEITAAFEALSEDDGVGAIVVTGEGRGFMAGADIKEYAAQTAPEFDSFQAAGTRMYAAIEGNRKPVIAAVNGFALGGGMELVLCCDIVIANQFAKLGLPEIKLGLIPGGGGTQRSVAKLGRNRANLLLMTGAIVLASEFVDAGLVNEVVDAEQLMPRALELAAMIAAEPPAAIEGLKRLTAHAVSGDLAERPRNGTRHPWGPLPQRDRAEARARVRREERRAGQEDEAVSGAGPGGQQNMSLVKPNRPRFVKVEELAAMVRLGDRFGVGGHHFARLPIALLRAIAGSDVKDLRYISWAGGLPLELLLEAEAVAEIDICFSSLDIFGLPPRFRATAETNALPVRDWTALAMIQALRAAQQNLPSMPFQLPEGSDMLARMPHAKIVRDPVNGAEIGIIPALRIDTFVLHAQRADESGNVRDHRAARTGLRDGRRRAPGAGHRRGDRSGRRAQQSTAARAS